MMMQWIQLVHGLSLVLKRWSGWLRYVHHFVFTPFVLTSFIANYQPHIDLFRVAACAAHCAIHLSSYLPSILMPLPSLRHSKLPSVPPNSTPSPKWPPGALIWCGAFISVLCSLTMLSGCFLSYPAPPTTFSWSGLTLTPFGSPYTSKCPPGPVSQHGTFVPSILDAFRMLPATLDTIWSNVSLPGLFGLTQAPQVGLRYLFSLSAHWCVSMPCTAFLGSFGHPQCMQTLPTCVLHHLNHLGHLNLLQAILCAHTLPINTMNYPLGIRFRRVQPSSNQFRYNLEDRGWTELQLSSKIWGFGSKVQAWTLGLNWTSAILVTLA